MVDSHAEVLIVGAGASGGVAALRLARAGVRVVCLEQGHWPDRGDFRGTEPDWELSAQKRWSGSPNQRRAPEDYPIDDSSSDISILNYNGVGGGTVLYNAQWPRMSPADFAVRSLDGVAEDWPLRYGDLLPYYEQTDREIGVSGLAGNPMFPPGADPPLPPLPIGRAGLLLARAHNRLGWHWWPETNAILSAPYLGRRPCVQRGACGQGCAEGAKSSTDLSHLPGAVAAGARVIVGARVHRLDVDRRGLVTGAEWSDCDGARRFQSADVVLLAANGVGTPRLLLNSASARFPDGLANESGLVGKRLMLHPLATVTGYFDDDLRSWQGQAGGAIQSMEFYGSDADRGFVRGARWSLIPTGGPLRNALGGRGPAAWGREHHRDFRRRFGRGAAWVLICEDLPEESNRVELSPSLADSSGVPAPRVAYRVSENSRRLREWHAQRAAESLREAGAHTTEVTIVGRNGHLMGTARMGRDPHSSVVDPWGMTHGIPNLGIIDGSVFVTAGGANPTSTICALALRAADHLLERRSTLPLPERVRAFPVLEAFSSSPSARPGGGATVSAVSTHLTDRERGILSALADALIPAEDGMPAASEVGVHGALAERVLGYRPDLAAPLRRALAASAPGDPSPAVAPSIRTASLSLDELRRVDRPAHHALLVVVAAGYYLSPEVRALIGYAGQEAIAVDPLAYPDYVSEGLLDGVLERAHRSG